MLKVRYNRKTGLLSGWTDIGTEFATLIPREDEEVIELDIIKPSADDYEYFLYQGSVLKDSGKTAPKPPRDLATEFDNLKDKLKNKGVI